MNYTNYAFTYAAVNNVRSNSANDSLELEPNTMSYPSGLTRRWWWRASAAIPVNAKVIVLIYDEWCNKIANSVRRDAVHIFCQGVIYFQNVVRLYGKRVNVNFIYANQKTTALPAPISTALSHSITCWHLPPRILTISLQATFLFSFRSDVWFHRNDFTKPTHSQIALRGHRLCRISSKLVNKCGWCG